MRVATYWFYQLESHSHWLVAGPAESPGTAALLPQWSMRLPVLPG
jgi:hypothetical protein